MSTAEINSALARAMVIAKSQPPDPRYLEALEAVISLPDYINSVEEYGFEIGDPKELLFRSAAATAWLAGVFTKESEAFIN